MSNIQRVLDRQEGLRQKRYHGEKQYHLDKGRSEYLLQLMAETACANIRTFNEESPTSFRGLLAPEKIQTLFEDKSSHLFFEIIELIDQLLAYYVKAFQFESIKAINELKDLLGEYAQWNEKDNLPSICRVIHLVNEAINIFGVIDKYNETIDAVETAYDTLMSQRESWVRMFHVMLVVANQLNLKYATLLGKRFEKATYFSISALSDFHGIPAMDGSKKTLLTFALTQVAKFHPEALEIVHSGDLEKLDLNKKPVDDDGEPLNVNHYTHHEIFHRYMWGGDQNRVLDPSFLVETIKKRLETLQVFTERGLLQNILLERLKDTKSRFHKTSAKVTEVYNSTGVLRAEAKVEVFQIMYDFGKLVLKLTEPQKSYDGKHSHTKLEVINSKQGSFERAPGIWVPANVSEKDDGNFTVFYTKIGNRFKQMAYCVPREKVKVKENQRYETEIENIKRINLPHVNKLKFWTIESSKRVKIDFDYEELIGVFGIPARISSTKSSGPKKKRKFAQKKLQNAAQRLALALPQGNRNRKVKRRGGGSNEGIPTDFNPQRYIRMWGRIVGNNHFDGAGVPKTGEAQVQQMIRRDGFDENLIEFVKTTMKNKKHLQSIKQISGKASTKAFVYDRAAFEAEAKESELDAETFERFAHLMMGTEPIVKKKEDVGKSLTSMLERKKMEIQNSESKSVATPLDISLFVSNVTVDTMVLNLRSEKERLEDSIFWLVLEADDVEVKVEDIISQGRRFLKRQVFAGAAQGVKERNEVEIKGDFTKWATAQVHIVVGNSKAESLQCQALEVEIPKAGGTPIPDLEEVQATFTGAMSAMSMSYMSLTDVLTPLPARGSTMDAITPSVETPVVESSEKRLTRYAFSFWSGPVPYPEHINQELRAKGKCSFRIEGTGKQYEVDLKSMLQMNVHSNHVREIYEITPEIELTLTRPKDAKIILTATENHNIIIPPRAKIVSAIWAGEDVTERVQSAYSRGETKFEASDDNFRRSKKKLSKSWLEKALTIEFIEKQFVEESEYVILHEDEEETEGSVMSPKVSNQDSVEIEVKDANDSHKKDLSEFNLNWTKTENPKSISKEEVEPQSPESTSRKINPISHGDLEKMLKKRKKKAKISEGKRTPDNSATEIQESTAGTSTKVDASELVKRGASASYNAKQGKLAQSHDGLHRVIEARKNQIAESKTETNCFKAEYWGCKYAFHPTVFRNWLQDAIAIFDLASDFALYIQMIEAQILGLMVLMTCSLTFPYLISYSSSVQSLLQRGVFDDVSEHTFLWHIGMLIYLNWTGVFYFVVVELVLYTWHLFGICFICSTRESYDWYERQMESFLTYSFGLSIMEAEGYVRQQNIAQLMFESLPQLIIQAVMVSDDRVVTQLNSTTLYVSITFTFLNAMSQFIRVYIESRMVDEPIMKYAFTCMQARAGWVPFLHKLEIDASETDYDNIKSFFHEMTGGYDIASLRYLFSEDTMRRFIEEFGSLEAREKHLRPIVKMRNSVKLVSAQSVAMLLDAAKDKVRLKFNHGGKMDWNSLVESSAARGRPVSKGLYGTIFNGVPLCEVILESDISVGERLEFCRALLTGDLAMDPNQKNRAGDTLLLYGLKNLRGKGSVVNMQFVKLLLKSNADPNLRNEKTFQTPLSVVISSNMKYRNKKKLINLLIKHGADFSIRGHALDHKDTPQSLLTTAYDSDGDWSNIIDLIVLAAKNGAKWEKAEEHLVFEMVVPIILRGTIKKFKDIFIKHKAYDNILVKNEDGDSILHDLIKQQQGNQDPNGVAFGELLQYAMSMDIDLTTILDKRAKNVVECMFEEALKYGGSADRVNQFLRKEELHSLVTSDIVIPAFLKAYQDNQHGQINQVVNSFISFGLPDSVFITTDGKNIWNHIVDASLEYNVFQNCAEYFFEILGGPHSMADSVAFLKNPYLAIVESKRLARNSHIRILHNFAGEELLKAMEREIARGLIVHEIRTLRECSRRFLKDEKMCIWLVEHAPHMSYWSSRNELLLDLAEEPLRSTLKKIIEEKQLERKVVEAQTPEEQQKEFEIEKKATRKLRRAGTKAWVNQGNAPEALVIDSRKTKESVRKDIQSERRGNLFGSASRLGIELLSLGDLLTDIFILIKMIRNGHPWWTTWTILCMISPYMIMYATLVTFFLLSGTFQGGGCVNILGLAYLSPLCLIYFITIDAIFITYSFISDSWTLLTLGYFDIISSDELSRFFLQSFGLTLMDICGLRRLRTLTQFTFESIPQILLQVWILRSDDAENLGLNANEIYFSLCFAFLHCLIEFIVLYFESKACKMNILHYAVVCLGGRIGWVPFLHIFQRPNRDQKFESDLDYDDLTFNLMGRECKMLYEFSETTLERLILSLVYFPKLPKEQRTVMHLGNTVDAVKLDQLLILDDLAAKRLDLRLTTENYLSAIKHTYGKNMEDLWHAAHPIFGGDLASWAVAEGKNELFRALLKTNCADPEGDIKMNQANCRVYPVVYFCLTNNYVDAVLSLLESGAVIEYEILDQIDSILTVNKHPWQMLRILRDHMPSIMYNYDLYGRLSKFVDSGDTNLCYSLYDALGGFHANRRIFDERFEPLHEDASHLTAPVYSLLSGDQPKIFQDICDMPGKVWIVLQNEPKAYPVSHIECFNVLRDTLPFPFGSTQVIKLDEEFPSYLDGSVEAPYDLRELKIPQKAFDDMITAMEVRGCDVETPYSELDSLAERLDMFKENWKLIRNTSKKRKIKTLEVQSQELLSTHLKESSIILRIPDDFIALHVAHVYAKGRALPEPGGSQARWHHNGCDSSFVHDDGTQTMLRNGISLRTDLVHQRVNANVNEARKAIKVGDLVLTREGEGKVARVDENGIWLEDNPVPYNLNDPDFLPKDINVDLEWDALNGLSAKYEYYFTDMFNGETLCYSSGDFVWGKPQTTEHIFIRSARSPGLFEPFNHPGVTFNFHDVARPPTKSIQEHIMELIQDQQLLPSIMNIASLGIMPHQLNSMSTVIPWFALGSAQTGDILRREVAFRPVSGSDLILIETRLGQTLVADGSEAYFVETRPEKQTDQPSMPKGDLYPNAKTDEYVVSKSKNFVEMHSETETSESAAAKGDFFPYSQKESKDFQVDLSRIIYFEALTKEQREDAKVFFEPILGNWYDLATRVPVARIRTGHIHFVDGSYQKVDLENGKIVVSRKGQTMQATYDSNEKTLQWDVLEENTDGGYQWRPFQTWAQQPIKIRQSTKDTQYTMWKVINLGGPLISLQTESGKYLEMTASGLRLTDSNQSPGTRIIRNTLSAFIRSNTVPEPRAEIQENNPFLPLDPEADKMELLASPVNFHVRDKHGKMFQRRTVIHLPQTSTVQVSSLVYETFEEIRTSKPGDIWILETNADADMKLQFEYYVR